MSIILLTARLSRPETKLPEQASPPASREAIAWAPTIEAALRDLGGFLQESAWEGRENEFVNLFAHAFLLHPKQGGAIQPGQIGIEVAVRQLRVEDDKTMKKVVRKDLVLWNRPNETLWLKGEAVNDPAAVIEFKVNDHRKCSENVEWLRAFTARFPSVLGYSVCGFLQQSRGVWYARISGGQVQMEESVPRRG